MGASPGGQVLVPGELQTPSHSVPTASLAVGIQAPPLAGQTAPGDAEPRSLHSGGRPPPPTTAKLRRRGPSASPEGEEMVPGITLENIPLILRFVAVGAVDLQRYLRDSTCFRYLIKMIHPVLYFVAAGELRDIRRQI